MKIAHVMSQTGWALLAQQKLALLGAISIAADSETEEQLTGLLHWIDALQDAAEIDGYPVVFLTEDK